MFINTTNFGKLDIDEEMVIRFDKGLPGFEKEHEFVILNNWDTEEPVGFMWLQSTQNEDLAFVVSIPFLLRPDYEFEIPDDVCQEMDLKDPSDVGVYTICKIDSKVENMTFNLTSPIIINSENRKARQLTLSDERYKVRESFRQHHA